MRMSRYDMFLTGLVVLALGQSVLPRIAGRIEGTHWPVVTRAEITSAEKVDNDINLTAFFGTSSKIRDCEFARIFWRIGKPGGPQAPAQLSIRETDKVRDTGEFSFGPWETRMTPGDLLYNSEGFAVHHCHNLWETITPFYAPPPMPKSPATVSD